MRQEDAPADDLVEAADEFIRSLPDPRTYETKDNFMTCGVDAMNELLRLAMTSVSLVRPHAKSYTKRHAPIVGLTVRMIKLYQGILREIAERHAELSDVYKRPFLEAHVTCTYLMKNDRASARSFVVTSYRAEKEMLAHLNGIRRSRPLLPIEKRMRESILWHIKNAGLSQRELLSCKSWRLDGKNIRAILEFLGWSLSYAFGFAASSHAVHGTWYDLVVHHLHREGSAYLPELRFTTPDPRMIAPTSIVLAEHLRAYVLHFSLDAEGTIDRVLGRFASYFDRFDQSWEKQLVEESE